jgi:polyferredoxin
MAGKTTHVARPRLFVYGGLLSLAACTIAYSLAVRTPLLLDVIRDRNTLFREVHGDWIENAYTIKVINEDDKPHSYRLEARGLERIELAAPSGTVDVAPGTVSNVPVRLQAPADLAHGVHAITLRITALDDPSLVRTEKTRFIGP